MLTGSRVRNKCVCEPSKREPLIIPEQLKGGGYLCRPTTKDIQIFGLEGNMCSNTKKLMVIYPAFYDVNKVAPHAYFVCKSVLFDG